MRAPLHVGLIGVAALLLVGAGTLDVQSGAAKTTEEIRNELLQLPYYGVFDFLAFSYDRGTVTLLG